MSRFTFALVGAILLIGNHTISEYLRVVAHAGRSNRVCDVSYGIRKNRRRARNVRNIA